MGSFSRCRSAVARAVACAARRTLARPRGNLAGRSPNDGAPTTRAALRSFVAASVTAVVLAGGCGGGAPGPAAPTSIGARAALPADVRTDGTIAFGTALPLPAASQATTPRSFRAGEPLYAEVRLRAPVSRLADRATLHVTVALVGEKGVLTPLNEPDECASFTTNDESALGAKLFDATSFTVALVGSPFPSAGPRPDVPFRGLAAPDPSRLGGSLMIGCMRQYEGLVRDGRPFGFTISVAVRPLGGGPARELARGSVQLAPAPDAREGLKALRLAFVPAHRLPRAAYPELAGAAEAAVERFLADRGRLVPLSTAVTGKRGRFRHDGGKVDPFWAAVAYRSHDGRCFVRPNVVLDRARDGSLTVVEWPEDSDATYELACENVTAPGAPFTDESPS
jgi:hypothetical protein